MKRPLRMRDKYGRQSLLVPDSAASRRAHVRPFGGFSTHRWANRPFVLEALGASQQNISKHLGILHAAGMVARAKRGNSAVYSISDPAVFELCEQVCGGVRRQVEELEQILQPAG